MRMNCAGIIYLVAARGELPRDPGRHPYSCRHRRGGHDGIPGAACRTVMPQEPPYAQVRMAGVIRRISDDLLSWLIGEGEAQPGVFG
jgi:hypothetical protein